MSNRRSQPRADARGWCVAACLLVTSACATKIVTPPVPTTPAHAEFVYPTVPPVFLGRPGASLIEIGWRYLQNDKTSDAERTFEVALKQNNTLYPARAGQGYVALARRDFTRALSAFDSTLKAAPSYAPALVGRGHALIGLGREEEALQPFEAAMAIDSSLTDVRRRIDVLKFRGLQEVIEAARDAVRKGREPEARAAYARALAASPESAFLHRELGMLDRKTGHPDKALEELTRASELDPSDAAAFVQIGELLDEKSDYAGAEAAYRKAADLEPTPELSVRLATVAKKAREAKLPPEFRASLTSAQLTRGDLAALIGVRFDDLIRDAPPRQVVITDTRGYWAADWIMPVARAGIMDPFANHTFQPRTRLRRGDLAMVVPHTASGHRRPDAAPHAVRSGRGRCRLRCDAAVGRRSVPGRADGDRRRGRRRARSGSCACRTHRSGRGLLVVKTTRSTR
jgi:tetratricopeptide (TPR) repeat protein